MELDAAQERLVNGMGKDIADIPCGKCGGQINLAVLEPTKTMMMKRGLCFKCNFWTNYVARQDDPLMVRVNGMHYYIGREEDKLPLSARGYAGRLFIVQFHDGRLIRSTNMWHQGVIPERFAAELPDNAIFLKEEQEQVAPPEPDGWRKFFLGWEVYYCCLKCGWIPLEKMVNYRLLHGLEEATCIRCNSNLFQLEQEGRKEER